MVDRAVVDHPIGSAGPCDEVAAAGVCTFDPLQPEFVVDASCAVGDCPDSGVDEGALEIQLDLA